MSTALFRRVAVVISHPIQHFCPQYCSWAGLSHIGLHVFFASRHGLVPYQDKDFGQTVEWGGLRLDFPHTFLPGADGRQVDFRTDCAELEVALDAFDPDAVVIYGYAQKLQRRAAKWAASRTVAAIMVSDSTAHHRTRWWKRLAKAIVLPSVYRRIDVFLTVGDSNEAYYRHYGVDDSRMARCPLPIDVNSFDVVLRDRDVVRSRLRAALSIPSNHTVLLMVGKLVPWKRQVDLVRFSNWCQGRREKVTVVLAGTGSDQGALSKAAMRQGPGGVIFAGFVQPKDLLAYYCAADIYVHCSDIEPHSLAISEAIYAGLPVVLSDRCGSYGPTDDVRPGLNGFSYVCGQPAALAAVLFEIIDRPALRESMARTSSEIAQINQTLAHGRALSQALELLKMNARS